MSTDQDYIDSKKKDKGGSSDSDKSPNYIKWVIEVIKNFVIVLILFAIGSGAIATANNPKYNVPDEDTGKTVFGNWPGTDIEGTPYCCPGETSNDKKKKSASGILKDLFDLNKYNKPYNIGMVRKLLANESEINSLSMNDDNEDAELPEHLQPDLDGRALMWPWAIRMTAYSYSYMRQFLEAGLLGFFPKFEGESNWKTSLAFTLGGLLLFVIFALLHILPIFFTILGAIPSFTSFAWIGWKGLGLLCIPFLIPAILYIFVGVIGVPIITGLINNFIQPYFYLGFMFEPIINNFEAVKKIMISHAHIMGITGIIITIIQAFAQSGDVPMFRVGALIAGCLVLAMAKNKEMSNKNE